MSFKFEWPTFSEGFYSEARELLCSALNKGEKPPVIAGPIEVKDLNMGTIPPELEILEIGDLTKDRFRGIFRLTYAGDALIELQTSVQANPLMDRKPQMDILSAPTMLFAAAPLIVPMRLRLSGLRLRAIIVLVVSRQKGITLVFKNDPLERVDVSSTFDSVSVVQSFIQREIEGQLRELFRTDLPAIIHRLSQRWLAETAARSGARRGFEPTATIQTRTAPPNNGEASATSMQQRMPSNASLSSSPPRGPLSVAEEIESYDPTYGLRPQGLPAQPGLERYNRLLFKRTHSRGLGDLLGDPREEDETVGPADSSYDHVGLYDLVDDGFPWSSPASANHSAYEVLPAVGGGLISRPRVIHTQSQVMLGSGARSSSSSQAASSTVRAGEASTSQTTRMARSVGNSALGHPSTRSQDAPQIRRHTAPHTPLTPGDGDRVTSYFPPSLSYTRSASWASTRRSSLLNPTMASSFTSLRPSTGPHSPTEQLKSFDLSDDEVQSDEPETPQAHRRGRKREPTPPPFLSGAPRVPINALDPPDPTTTAFGPPPSITINPLRNEAAAQLVTLSATHQTLSPFTRAIHHRVLSRPMVLARASSMGPLLHADGRTSPVHTSAPVRGRRKRVHVLGH